RLELFAQLADYNFFLGHFAAASHLVVQAQRLAPRAPERALDAASVAWVQAQLDRLRGNAEEALGPMRRVATIYAHEAPPISQGRCACFVAELILDIIERLPAGSSSEPRTRLLRSARASLEQGEHLARQVNDQLGRGLCTLAHVRYSRLRGGNHARSRR